MPSIYSIGLALQQSQNGFVVTTDASGGFPIPERKNAASVDKIDLQD